MKTDWQLLMDGLFCKKKSDEIEKYIMKSMFKRISENGMIIYKRDNASAKAVVFLSGGTVLQFTHYLRKLNDDLRLKDADILVFENKKTLNLTCIPHITDNLQNSLYSDIIIIGCSLGGVIGSHILSRLYNKKTKLICIDTPFHIHSTIPQAFENKRCIWRPDIYSLYKHTIQLVQGTYNYSDIFKIINLEQYKEYVYKHFGVNNYEFISSVNPNIKDCEIISLYNKKDPLVIRCYNVQVVEKYQSSLNISSTFKEVHIKYDGPGHCTEWTDYNRKFVRQLKKFI
jgi:hypothetical protein